MHSSPRQAAGHAAKGFVKTKFLFPELAEEKDAADRVKREARILVILGNPPYNAFAGVSPDEEQGLVEPYKKGLISEWGIKKFNLDDLYVRFFRLAEKRIAEHGEKRGVVCFISNYSYLSDPSFVVMRERFLQEFDHLWVDCMNGDSRETGKLTPEGKPDPSVFSTSYTHEGIRVGTVIGLMVKRGQKKAGESRTKLIGQLVRFRSFWGVNKRQDLLTSLRSNRFNSNYQTAAPDKNNRFSFRPSNVTGKYLRWPKINDLSRVPPFNGPIERRQNSLIRFRNEKSGFIQLAAYLDSQKLDKEIQTLSPAFMKSSGEFKAEKTRTGLKGRVRYNESHIVPYPFKPFDIRLAYLDDSIQPLFSRPSPQLLGQRFADNSFFITRDTADKDPEGPPFLLSKLVCDYDCLSGHARHFPIMLKISEAGLPRHVNSNGQHVLAGGELTKIIANLSPAAREYMTKLGFSNPDSDPETASLIWMHALAIGYSPAYLKQNADGIRQDWPRIPLPAKKAALLASAALGRKIAALLDTETPVPGVTAGKIRPELKDVGAITRVDGRQLNPDAGDFDITAGWGHGGKGGITMPGKGKLLDNGDSYDVFLNGVACWRCVPKPVWEYTIGGYQVIKKWLSYREKTLLGRGLTIEEVREVTQMIRRLAAIVALLPGLDKNYSVVRDDPYDFPPGKAIKPASS